MSARKMKHFKTSGTSRFRKEQTSTGIFVSQNTSGIRIAMHDSLYDTRASGDNEFSFTQRLRQDAPYTVFVSSENLPNADSIGYSITVVPDRYPAIQVSQVNDSVNKKYLYFIGETSDDYGLRNLALKYKLTKDGTNEEAGNTKLFLLKFPAEKWRNSHSSGILNELQLAPGDRLVYFFEVWTMMASMVANPPAPP
jgi:hypothetical protein